MPELFDVVELLVTLPESNLHQGVISCPVDYPDSCRGGFTNNIWQKRTISQTRPGHCIIGDLSDMILLKKFVVRTELLQPKILGNQD